MVELIRGRLSETSPPGRGQAASALSDLAPGRVLKGAVVGPQPGGLTLIRLSGMSLLAETSLPLAPGQTLTLVVRETRPQLVLALVEEPPPPPNPLPGLVQELLRGRQRLGGHLTTLLGLDLKAQAAPSPKAAELAERLQELVRQMLLDGATADQGRSLPRLMALAGLDLEARLAEVAQGRLAGLPPSLRALLPQLLRELEPLLGQLTRNDPGLALAWRGFLAAGLGLAEYFEQNARLNAQLLPQAQLLLGLPLAWGQEFRPGELLIGLPAPGQEGQDQEEAPLRLVFFLELASLGPLAIEVVLRGQDLLGVFITDDPAKASFLEGRLESLSQSLAQRGYRAQLSARARPQEAPAAASPLAELIRRQGSYLSLRV
ncbi:MAG: hypothetical protein V1806_14690 [Pseudomonadota bacterium]